jgi:phosphoribosylanthranilate isomerase
VKAAPRSGQVPAATGVKVKICGITSLDDAKAAVDAGADALGFNFYPKSPRYIALKEAAAIVTKLPPMVTAVALFVDPPQSQVLEALRACRWGALQFHGDEDPDFLSAFPWDLQIKAARIKDKGSLSHLKAAYARCGAWLVDAAVAGEYGGTGKLARWDLAALAAKVKPVLLAGGLTEENVAEAVRKVKPWGVDTASGVEKAPGKKDAKKMRAFVLNAKRALEA